MIRLQLSTIVGVIFLLFSCNNSKPSKKNTDLKSFKIQVEKNEQGLKLNCLNGCAWKELTLSKNNYQPQAVNEFGMFESGDKLSIHSDENLAKFLFTVAKTEDGIKMVGKEGTAWKELEFKVKNYQPKLIDQMGMIK